MAVAPAVRLPLTMFGMDVMMMEAVVVSSLVSVVCFDYKMMGRREVQSGAQKEREKQRRVNGKEDSTM